MSSPLLNYRATEEQIAESLGLVVMPSNNTGSTVRDLHARFPGRLAHLMTPGGWRRPFMPYALDNGAFGAYLSGKPFNKVAFGRLLAHALLAPYPPLWVAVPDVVADADATIEAWHEWAPKLRPWGWPLAFVVQDGMIRQDVPEDADFVFVGGTLEWKWAWVPAFAAWFGKRLHVGRVNSPAALDWLDQLGVGSCDGTGWLRGDPRQLRGLIDFGGPLVTVQEGEAMRASTRSTLDRVEKKLLNRAIIGYPDELELSDVLKIAQRTGFYCESDRYVHVAAVCIEQAERHAAIEKVTL